MPDRTALVTGGAGGLGRSVVDALLAHGWRVVVPVQRTGSDPQRAGLSTITADLHNPDDGARTGRAATRPAGGGRPAPPPPPAAPGAAEGAREPGRRLRRRPAGGRHAAGRVRA